MTSKQSPEISVIIPVFNARAWIETTMISLARQSLPYRTFEVLLVYNGPEDGTSKVVSGIRQRYPQLQVREFYSDPPSAAIARNHAMVNAAGRFVAFLDSDDWISDRYLELLLAHSNSGQIPVAQIADVHSDGRIDYRNRFNSLILSQEEPSLDPRRFYTPLSFMASKMYPTEWVKQTLFDETLRSSEDVEFNYRLFARYNFRFNLFPAAVGATYFRRRTSNSVSRREFSKDFLINQRVAAIRAFSNSRTLASHRKQALFMRPIRAQLNLMRKYVEQAPHDERREIFETLIGLGISDLDWSPLQERPRKLVIALNFLPSADTGAIMAAKRIWQDAQTVDVISGDLSNLRDVQPQNSMISAPYVRRQKMLKPAIRWFGSKLEVAKFIKGGLSTFNEWTAEGNDYSELYSRSMWPHSHFLAAAIKRQNPQIHWEAEFSDPVSLTVEGKYRAHPSVSDDIRSFFDGWGSSEQQALLNASPHVMRWAELLPYFFADTIVMTNHNQSELMLSDAPATFRDDIKAKIRVKPHPTLPRCFYNIFESSATLAAEKINIAYFGNFYATRGMSEIFDALDKLNDDDLGSFCFQIYTSASAEEVTERVSPRVRNIVEVMPKLEFLDFLSSLEDYDVLIVNDAYTADYFPINPYRPSKISDYQGSKTPVWAVVEPGSSLSSVPVSYQSNLHDTEGAKRVLQRIIEDSQHKRQTVTT